MAGHLTFTVRMNEIIQDHDRVPVKERLDSLEQMIERAVLGGKR